MRRAAVEKLWDQDVLAQVAQQDPEFEVRLAAVERISDDSLLAAISQADSRSNARAAAVGRLSRRRRSGGTSQERPRSRVFVRPPSRASTNSRCIAEAATRDPSPEVRAPARSPPGQSWRPWQRSHARTLLRRCVRKQSSASATQSRLADFAVRDPSPRVRAVAVSRLTHQDRLEAIAEEDPDALVRSSAVVRLNNLSQLNRIAVQDPAPEVRTLAVERVSEHDLLEAIAQRDPDPVVREVAVERLLRQDLISEIAQKDADPDVRATAVRKLADSSPLERDRPGGSKPRGPSDTPSGQLSRARVNCRLAARTDPSPEVRAEAVSRLNDQALIESIARGDVRVRWFARRAVDKISEVRLLADIAQQDFSQAVRAAATGRLHDQSLLQKIARTDRDWSCPLDGLAARQPAEPRCGAGKNRSQPVRA